jgi:hypothetical protein
MERAHDIDCQDMCRLADASANEWCDIEEFFETQAGCDCIFLLVLMARTRWIFEIGGICMGCLKSDVGFVLRI